MIAKRKIAATSGIREFCVSSDEKMFLTVAYDVILVYDTLLGSPISSLKLDSCPRLVRLSSNGYYFAVFESNNVISVYETKSCSLLQRALDVPHSIKHIRFSKSSTKMLFASTQILSLWNIRSCGLEIRTENWKNINCYDINDDGSQFAIGTYNGTIFVLSYLGNGRCGQIQIRRHKTCVIAVCFHLNKIVSASYDGYLIISTLTENGQGERLVTYNEIKISYMPREIESVGSNFYLLDHRGVTWFTSTFTLVGLVDSRAYKVLANEEGKIVLVKMAVN